MRAHGTTNVDFADSGEGWGFKDFRRLIDQLAKMKYNRLNIGGLRLAALSAYEVDGIKRQTVALWYGFHYPNHSRHAGPVSLSRRTPRNSGTPICQCMERPDELLAAGVQLQQRTDRLRPQPGHGVRHQRDGQRVSQGIRSRPGRCSCPIRMMSQLTTTPGPKPSSMIPGLHKLSSTVVRATIDTYPTCGSREYFHQRMASVDGSVPSGHGMRSTRDIKSARSPVLHGCAGRQPASRRLRLGHQFFESRSGKESRRTR